jgi:hypothetical protein
MGFIFMCWNFISILFLAKAMQLSNFPYLKTFCLVFISSQLHIFNLQNHWFKCLMQIAGKDKVWCLYPNKNVATKSVQDAVCQEISADPECNTTMVLFSHSFSVIAMIIW